MLKATVVLPYTTNLPRDVSTNTFWFGYPLIGPGDPEEVAEWLEEFYIGPVNGPTVGQFLSGVISRATDACRVEIYDTTRPAPNPPIHTHTFTLPANTTTLNLPNEVAVCASFQAPVMPGQPQARRRGRIYVGPLKVNVAEGDHTVAPRPGGVFVDTLVGACERLAGHEGPSPGNRWIVWSTVNQSGAAVTNGWVNNEFDTQRRRQPAESARDVWSISI